MKEGRERRRLSAGSVVMLVLLAVVLGSSVFVLSRLSSGARVDLSRLQMGLLDLWETGESAPDGNGMPQANPAETVPSASAPAAETAPAGESAPTEEPAPEGGYG